MKIFKTQVGGTSGCDRKYSVLISHWLILHLKLGNTALGSLVRPSSGPLILFPPLSLSIAPFPFTQDTVAGPGVCKV